MNIILRGKLFNGDDLSNDNFSNLPSEIQNFIQGIRNDAVLRWGGDFDDPVHIDDGLNINEPATWDAKFPIIQAELIALSQPNTLPGEPKLLQLTDPLMKGKDVLAVQQKLIQLGFNIDDDGKFGPNTDAAVTAFQEKNSLTPDGIVGDKTRKALGL